MAIQEKQDKIEEQRVNKSDISQRRTAEKNSGQDRE